MSSTTTRWARPAEAEPLTAAQMGKREMNLAHLLIIAHKEGVPAAMAEHRRKMAEIQATKARSSQPA